MLAAVFLGWLVWVILYHGRPLVQSELVTYDVRGQHAAEARVTVVRRSADVEASCLLRASASDHSVVGELSLPRGPVRPGDGHADPGGPHRARGHQRRASAAWPRDRPSAADPRPARGDWAFTGAAW